MSCLPNLNTTKESWIFENVSLLMGKKLGETININFATGHMHLAISYTSDGCMNVDRKHDLIIPVFSAREVKLSCVVSRRLNV